MPPGVDDPQVYRQRSGGIFLPVDAHWEEATAAYRQAFVDHPELLSEDPRRGRLTFNGFFACRRGSV